MGCVPLMHKTYEPAALVNHQSYSSTALEIVNPAVKVTILTVQVATPTVQVTTPSVRVATPTV